MYQFSFFSVCHGELYFIFIFILMYAPLYNYGPLSGSPLGSLNALPPHYPHNSGPLQCACGGGGLYSYKVAVNRLARNEWHSAPVCIAFTVRGSFFESRVFIAN